jgi:hypothetical protein
VTTTKKNLHIPGSIVRYFENNNTDDEDEDDAEDADDDVSDDLEGDGDDEDLHYHLISLLHPKRISNKYHTKEVSRKYPAKGRHRPTQDYFHPTKDYYFPSQDHLTIRSTRPPVGDRFLQSQFTLIV